MHILRRLSLRSSTTSSPELQLGIGQAIWAFHTQTPSRHMELGVPSPNPQ